MQAEHQFGEQLDAMGLDVLTRNRVVTRLELRIQEHDALCTKYERNLSEEQRVETVDRVFDSAFRCRDDLLAMLGEAQIRELMGSKEELNNLYVRARAPRCTREPEIFVMDGDQAQ